MNISKLKLAAASMSLLLTPTVVGAAETDSDSSFVSGGNISNVVVTGTRQATDLRYLPMNVSVVTRQQLTRNHQTSILPTLTQEVPGLFVTSRAMMGYGLSNGAAGGINMRGISAGGGQMLVLIDGHPQYANIYGHPIADSYQTMLADHVEVLHGPASVLYGSNAMGGVINIVTRKMEHDGARTSLNLGAGSYGTVQGELSTQMRKGRLSSQLAVQYQRSDNHRPRMGFEQEGGFAKVGYDLNANWRTWAAANLTHFVGSDPGAESQPMFSREQWITRGEAQAALENHYQATSGALTVYSNFGNHRIDDGWSEGKAPQANYFRSKDALSGFSLYQTAQLFEGNRVTVGLDYQHLYGRAYYTSKVSGDEVPSGASAAKSHRNEVAAYADVRQDISSILTVDAGLRWDHHSVAGSEWVPQVGLAVRTSDDSQLKATASKGFRNPSVRELYLYRPANEELEAERLWNYELSWHHRIDAFKYGVNVYYIKGDNMIQTVMLEAGPRNINTGEIENYGAELTASCQLSPHWAINTNHSMLHMENKVVAAPTYKGFLGAVYSDARLRANAGLQYADGLYTAVGANETKESFLLLNATVTCQLAPALALWLRGDNLLGQDYEINAGFPMPGATFMAGVNLAF